MVKLFAPMLTNQEFGRPLKRTMRSGFLGKLNVVPPRNARRTNPSILTSSVMKTRRR
jgi:hypothetical protein